jgi:hypothetical protein
LLIARNLVWRPSTSSTGGILFSGTGTCTGLDSHDWSDSRIHRELLSDYCRCR